MEVLYLGDRAGTSLHRAKAFERLGHKVTHISPREFFVRSKWIDRIEWRVSPRILSVLIHYFVIKEIGLKRFDLVWVDNGSLVSLELINELRSKASKIVNFNHDDPFGDRDWTRFKEYRRAISAYNLIVVVRKQNINEAINCGAQEIMYATRTADEVAHFPRKLNDKIKLQWATDVAFVGTWMPERGPFLLNLVELGVPLSIFGSGWHKAPEWMRLKEHHRKSHLEGDEYAYAIQCAKLSLGLLSKGNRDLHTTRSLEIPMLGGLLCAERTSEHMEMYDDGIEAILWSSANECAEKCLEYISDAKSERRNEIILAGQQRMKKNGNTSEGLIRAVIRRLNII